MKVRLARPFGDSGAVDVVLILLIAVLILVGLIFMRVYHLG